MEHLNLIYKNVKQSKNKAEAMLQKVQHCLDVQDIENAKKCADLASQFAYQALQSAQRYKYEKEAGGTQNKYTQKRIKIVNNIAKEAKHRAMDAHKLIAEYSFYGLNLAKIFEYGKYLFQLSLLLGVLILLFHFINIQYYPSDFSIQNTAAILFLSLSYSAFFFTTLGIAITIFLFCYFIIEIALRWVKSDISFPLQMGASSVIILIALIFVCIKYDISSEFVFLGEILFFLSTILFIKFKNKYLDTINNNILKGAVLD